MGVAWQAPPGAKPNRDDKMQEIASGLSLGRHPGWLLEAIGNNRPRGMAVTCGAIRAIQNPAYRPTGIFIFCKEHERHEQAHLFCEAHTGSHRRH